MRVSVLVFEINLHRYSALAVEVEAQGYYKKDYDSVSELVTGLELIGLIGKAEVALLLQDLRFDEGVPLFKGTVGDEALTKAGFALAALTNP